MLLTIFLGITTVVFALWSFFLLTKLKQWHNAAEKWKTAFAEKNELHWATNGQLFGELKKRPNNHFVMLIPRSVDEQNMGVEAHVCNMGGPKEVIKVLRAAQVGMSQVDGFDDEDDDDDEDDHEWGGDNGIKPLWDT